MSVKRLVIITINFLFLIFILSFSIKTHRGDESKTIVNTEINLSLMKDYLLLGSDNGLYLLETNSNKRNLIFDKPVVNVIKTSYGFFVLTKYEGIFFSEDLKTFKPVNDGIYSHKIKIFNQDKKYFETKVIIDYIKSIKVDPFDDSIVIANSSKNVYYSINKGLKWERLDIPSSHYSSITDSTIFSIKEQDRIKVYVAYGTSFKGFFIKTIGDKKWEEIVDGLYKYSNMIQDVSNIISAKDEDNKVRVFASNSFTPILYELDFKTKKWKQVFKIKKDFGMVESLYYANKSVYFVSEDGIYEYNLEKNTLNRIESDKIDSSLSSEEIKPNCLVIFKNSKPEYFFNSLWLLRNNFDGYKRLAKDKRGLYIQFYVPTQKKRFENILEIMKDYGLNMITIDMKDDFGILRFNVKDEVLKKMGVVQNPIDLDEFIKKCKENNIYTVARIVVFKDKVLYHYNNYELAIKDRNGKPWRGIVNKKGTEDYNSGFWVDPYSPKVWDYNVRIAKELIERGFDEIQFDYIRFPTDGINLGDAVYQNYEKGMDKETALLSFLLYARDNIKAPISIDIYGANGWHRTGSRTGQEVEILKDFVDVICPMYYPSHFSQDFLNYQPYEDRTYRIYYFGSFRNFYIAQKSVVIRPYVQAFKLNVSYDRNYYGPLYIENQVKGIINSIDMGYTFWNPGTNYIILKEGLLNIKNVSKKGMVNGETKDS
ncbi:MAG TPA: putative glycoside hydrolase [Spirochaetota bacterium]|nr:putative glycoside hydrolase [Spirochaetota bacterium]HOM38093.1 putative glycoside hydrolase [Spirochaetota bacterium]HPQ48895.1 putative glycoside hydrolase [Spirochaetota bacterium]